MSFTKHITKKDGKTGNILWEGDVELPSNLKEAVEQFGEDDVYKTFIAKKIIQIQSANDPRKPQSLIPKDALHEMREAIKSGVNVNAILDAVRKIKK